MAVMVVSIMMMLVVMVLLMLVLMPVVVMMMVPLVALMAVVVLSLLRLDVYKRQSSPSSQQMRRVLSCRAKPSCSTPLMNSVLPASRKPATR